MALQIHFFMTPADERELFSKLERLQLSLWPEFTDPGHEPARVTGALADRLDAPAYYFAVGEVSGYAIKRGPGKGQWKIDEVASPVLYFARSQMEEDELRSGYFWAEMEAAGDNSRLGGKPQPLLRLVKELQDFVKVRYRRSKPTGFLIAPGAARLAQAGTVLRESGRKGVVVVPYR